MVDLAQVHAFYREKLQQYAASAGIDFSPEEWQILEMPIDQTEGIPEKIKLHLATRCEQVWDAAWKSEQELHADANNSTWFAVKPSDRESFLRMMQPSQPSILVLASHWILKTRLYHDPQQKRFGNVFILFIIAVLVALASSVLFS
ncbi:MAG TPA: hypothetical protein PKL83_03985 [bacterium]|nr:hypothetical protein [bacterium]